ncbi:tetratricopeptide repeat protein [Stutzerimonas azotifigens]|uniref:tetratricopeptide repeat protein n=1 Tax=Stutzerimonas azotifigens TaxID=291995 RepID=UPI000428ED69|nr:tetratricopeptide repeat protein [Stutzerimonas azotifigens]
MTSATEDEQLAQLREFWQRSGKPLVAGAVLALAAVVGWQAWKSHETNQAQNASALYQQLLTQVLSTAEPDRAEIARLGGELTKSYGGSDYAQYARLFLAKVAVEAGEPADAVTELRAVLDDPASETLGELARQRLARVLAAQDKADEGLALLDGEAPASFAAGREELKGDLLVQLGRLDEAHAAYTRAKERLSPDAAVGGLQLKLDDLARGDA